MSKEASERKRVNKTAIYLKDAKVTDGKLFGAYATLSFTVAGSKEEADAGEFKQIENLRVNIDNVTLEDLISEGLKAWKVRQQSPMRSNIDKVEALSGTTVEFNSQLFASAQTRTAPITAEKATEFLMSQSAIDRVNTMIKMLEQANVAIPPALLEKKARAEAQAAAKAEDEAS